MKFSAIVPLFLAGALNQASACKRTTPIQKCFVGKRCVDADGEFDGGTVEILTIEDCATTGRTALLENSGQSCICVEDDGTEVCATFFGVSNKGSLSIGRWDIAAGQWLEPKNIGLGGAPGMWGDPHVKTWNGSKFDYHGECDLVMAQVDNFQDSGLDLRVHARTTISDFYSYITTAAVRIGEDTLEISSGGKWALNGVKQADLTDATLSGYRIEKPCDGEECENSWVVRVGKDESHHIFLSTWEEYVKVNIQNGAEYLDYKDVRGLMGNTQGKLLARDGVTVMTDINAFGQEWQVTADEPMIFSEYRAPQAADGQQCILPDETGASAARRLRSGVSHDAAHNACSGIEEDLEECVQDVMATGNLDIVEHYR